MYRIDYTSYRTIGAWNSRTRFLVLHYTALNFAKSVAALTGKSVSSHYLIPDPTDPSYIEAGFKDVVIFNLVNEQDRAWHAGVSAWEDRVGLNDSAIGIEIVNLAKENGRVWTFPDYNRLQICAVQELAVNIVQRYADITPTRVVGHSDIAYTRKNDPGPRFPWHALYKLGVGAWYDDEVKANFTAQFAREGLPTKLEMISAFKRYGYGVSDDVSDLHYYALVRAFQMHFRPDVYDGVLDIDTAACLFSLNEKYKN